MSAAAVAEQTFDEFLRDVLAQAPAGPRADWPTLDEQLALVRDELAQAAADFARLGPELAAARREWHAMPDDAAPSSTFGRLFLAHADAYHDRHDAAEAIMELLDRADGEHLDADQAAAARTEATGALNAQASDDQELDAELAAIASRTTAEHRLGELERLREGVYKTGPKGGRKLIAPRLARNLRVEAPAATGGKALYAYRDGAYRPDAEQHYKRRTAAALGDEWTTHAEGEALGYLSATAPALWERPPLDKLNVRNGILDLHAGTLGAHDPAHLSPIQLPVDYRPDATCPRIDAFLADVLPDDTLAVAHELAAYLITPDTRMQAAVMLLGTGANGKSTFLGLLTALLGAASVSAVPLHKLDEDRFAVAGLYGRLANVFADLDARALRSSSTFKAIVGEDAIDAERKYRDAFTFKPYARLLFSANQVPPTPDGSHAFFRRWLILPFERTFAKHEQNPRLLAELTTPDELAGLLNHALAALPALRARGTFTAADSTRRANEAFRLQADSVAGFLDEHCHLEHDGEIPRTDLFNAYRLWCEHNNRRPLSAQHFTARVRAHYDGTLDEKIVKGERRWVGIAFGHDNTDDEETA